MPNLDPNRLTQEYSTVLADYANITSTKGAVINAIVTNAPAAALTTSLTTLTSQTPSSADYAPTFLTLTDHADAAAFTSADMAETLTKVVANIQSRVAELEAAMQAFTLLS